MKKFLRSLLAPIPTSQYRESFAKDYLDQRLEPFIGKRKGFYVEAGANDGLSQSNTRYFEKYLGWTGILVEPVPELFKQCRNNRPNSIVENVALVADPDNTNVQMSTAGLMSVVDGAFKNEPDYDVERHLQRSRELGASSQRAYLITVPGLTLSSVLEKHGVSDFDFLSLDVEGYEAEVITGLDLQKHRPRCILVEERPNSGVSALLGKCYKKIAILSVNDNYVDALYERRA